jgi:hypothetical protein
VADTNESQGQAPETAAPGNDASEKDAKAKADAILKEAHARFKISEEAESETRKDALADIEFAAGKQWDSQIEAQRQADRRPCLVINRLPQFIRQVTNDQRQNRPCIKAHPVDDQADIETAKIYSGLIRHIEYNSNADAAYDTAFESAVRGGFGYWRVITDYTNPTSFDQEILIKRIRNPFSVYFDPFSKEPDGSDASFAFIVEDLSKDEYERAYPKSQLAQTGEWESQGNPMQGWLTKESARIAEYFYKEYRDTVLVQLKDGTTLEKSKLEEHMAEFAAQNPGQPVAAEIVQERVAKVPYICWCKITAVEMLEKTEWPGSYIPVVPIYGEELDINGKRVLRGIVRDAKDPQRMLNYWKSAETEAIALAPKAPWVVEEGQIEGYEADWETANARNHAFLKYKATSINGAPVPPPQRQSFEPAVQAITQAAMFAADDLKATTGIYDASLGNKSNESSGIAIQRRNTQAQTSNFHFVDNLTRSLKHTGRILLDLIPSIYDTARIARIIGEDGTQEVVQLNAPFEKDGKPVFYDMSVGQYDITVDVGPSYASKRQEAAASMLDLSRSYPQILQIAGDLFIKNMDWPGAQEIAERVKKTIPQNLIGDKKGQPQLPPQVTQQMQQMSGMIQQLTTRVHEQANAIETKREELESKERIELAKVQANVEIAMAQLGSKESLALLQHQLAEIETRMQLLKEAQPIGADVAPTQNIAPQMPAGAPGANGGEAVPHPIGGESPSPSMEGNHDNPTA